MLIDDLVQGCDISITNALELPHYPKPSSYIFTNLWFLEFTCSDRSETVSDPSRVNESRLAVSSVPLLSTLVPNAILQGENRASSSVFPEGWRSRSLFLPRSLRSARIGRVYAGTGPSAGRAWETPSEPIAGMQRAFLNNTHLSSIS